MDLNNTVIDKDYCMSSFLIFRYIFDEDKIFKEGVKRAKYVLPENKYFIRSSDDIDKAIKEELASVIDNKTAIMLSGRMDSAILASYLPLDLGRIRSGESKYLIRELFARRYPSSIPAVKLPMPRAVGAWLKDWNDPSRPEFLPHCVIGLGGN